MFLAYTTTKEVAPVLPPLQSWVSRTPTWPAPAEDGPVPSSAQMERRLLLSKGIPARRNLEKRGVVGHRERDLVDSIVGRAFS
jgi:hypothetical protein